MHIPLVLYHPSLFLPKHHGCQLKGGEGYIYIYGTYMDAYVGYTYTDYIVVYI